MLEIAMAVAIIMAIIMALAHAMAGGVEGLPSDPAVLRPEREVAEALRMPTDESEKGSRTSKEKTMSDRELRT